MLVMPTLGVTFHDVRNTIGRLIPVCQSNSLPNPPPRTRRTEIESVGSGVSSFGSLTNSSRRPAESASIRLTEFCHWNPPIRSGVFIVNRLTRLPPVTFSVSTCPPRPRGTRTDGSGCRKLTSRLKLRSGDQVTFEPISIGLGEIDSDGSVRDPLPSVTFWLRVQPNATLPHLNWRLRLAELRICWVVRRGSIEFRRMIDELVE